MPKKKSEWPTARAVAHMLGCSRQHVYRLQNRGDLTARDVREDGVLIRRFDPARVRKFAERALGKSPAPAPIFERYRPSAPPGTLTRIQVARALRRSVATVRRIEGPILKPRLDASGIWRFSRRKVDKLAAEIQAGRRLLGAFPLPSTPALTRKLPPNTIELCQSCARRAAHALKSSR